MNLAAAQLGRTNDPRIAEAQATGLEPWLIVFILSHVILGPLLWRSAPLATVHGLLTLAVAGWIGLRGRPAQGLWIASYIIGSEVLWRMADARLPWETGKYAVIVVLGLLLLRTRSPGRVSVLPAVFFALLLPSVLLTYLHPLVASASETVRFNLSGPASLAATVAFASGHRFSSSELQGALFASLAPLLGIAIVTLISTYLLGPVQFGGESIAATSGGYGANQVSTMLGFGAVACLLIIVLGNAHRGLRWAVFLLMCFFVVQSVMTFSRGGLFSALGAALIGGAFFVRNRRSRRRLLFLSVVALGLAQWLVVPRLDRFTAGALTDRFSDTNTTGRAELFEADLRLLRDNPLFGVGPGVAAFERSGIGATAAHTEFSRLLAEHGSFGALSLLLLAAMGIQGLRGSRDQEQRGAVAALLTWSLLTMLHTGMRLGAHGFVFGLAFAFVRPRSATAELAPDPPPTA